MNMIPEIYKGSLVQQLEYLPLGDLIDKLKSLKSFCDKSNYLEPMLLFDAGYNNISAELQYKRLETDLESSYRLAKEQKERSKKKASLLKKK